MLYLLLVALVLTSSGCGISQSSTDNVSLSVAQQSRSEPTPEPLRLSDPTCCKFGTPAPDELKEAWRQFVQDGPYRLAHPRDMNFRGEERVTSLYDFPWGELGYDQIPGADHLAAIVVDTTRTDDARFGLVIFSAPRNRNGAYVPHWLYRGRDLSRTSVTRVTGELSISEYHDDGTETICHVRWNRQQRWYICVRY